MIGGQFARLSKCMQWEALNCNSVAVLIHVMHCKATAITHSAVQYQSSASTLYISLCSIMCSAVQSSSHQRSFTDPETHFLQASFLCFDTKRFVHHAYLSPLPIVFWHPWPYPLIRPPTRESEGKGLGFIDPNIFSVDPCQFSLASIRLRSRIFSITAQLFWLKNAKVCYSKKDV